MGYGHRKNGSSYGNHSNGFHQNSAKHKIKASEPRKPIDLPKREPVNDGRIWYPSEQDVFNAHELMIGAVGGWTGLQVGMSPYATFLKEVKATKGSIYRKAAVLLQDIAMSRMFQDGHHRTAYVVTKDFLEFNGGEFKEKDEAQRNRFIKDIRKYSVDEIASWLEYGTTQKPS